MPLFTILTPTYNHSAYLAECIRSAQEQTFSDWEMIILDDGSTDSTGNVATSYALSDPRIHYHRQENQGIFRLAETYNKGLAMAKGRYISILEGDDIWLPDKLEHQFRVLEYNPGVVVCWGRAEATVAATGAVQAIAPPPGCNDTRLWPNQPAGMILNALYRENMIPAVTITFRKSALELAGGFKQSEGFPTTDLPTLLDMALQGSFHFLPEVVARWRVYPGQTTKLFPVEMTLKRWDHVVGHYEALSEPVRSELQVTRATIDHHFRNRLLVAYATSGRYRLMRGEFAAARRDYLKAIFFPSLAKPVWRLRAIIGFVFSLFHRNVEGLSRSLGKPSYQ